ncbi:MAG: hypothetical protein QOG48_397 [Verrucomicrobiota bacterium]|jgi:hypothetical protein
MIALGLIAAFATLLMAGCGICALLMRGWPVYNVAEFVSLGAFFGGAAVSLVLWAGGFFVSGPLLQGMVAICSVIIGALGWRAIRAHRVRFSFPKPRSPWQLLLFSVLTTALATVVIISLGKPLGWDSSFNWEIKARFAFLNGGTMPGNYYTSSGQALTHPEYPLFIPFTQLWIDLWIGSPHQFWEKTIFTMWAVAGIILLSLYAARLTRRRDVGLVTGIFVFFVPYLMRGAGGITSGYADFPLGVIYLIAIACLLLHRSKADTVYLRIYFAALPLLPWLKREGALLWIIAVATGVLLLRKRLTNPKSWLAFAPGLLVLIGWSLYLRVVGAAPSHDFVAMTPRTFAQHLGWIWPIAQTFVFELIRPDHWSLFWVLVFAAFVQQTFRRPTDFVGAFAFALVAPMILYMSIYMFSAWPDYLAHMRASLPRLLLQLTPLGCLLIASVFAASEQALAPRSNVEPAEECATLLPAR